MMNKQPFSTTVRVFYRFFRWSILIVGGFGVTLAYFMVLPLLQTIGRAPEKDMEIRSVDVSEEPPPPPPKQEKKEEKKEKPKPELKQPQKPMDLSELELALNPGNAAGMGGSFAVNLGKHAKNPDGMDSVFSMLELDQKPTPIYQPSPQYPRKLQRQGIDGTVFVVFVVGKDGRVHKAKVQKSTHPAFENPALEAVKRWKFNPGERQGKPVDFRMRIPIRFNKG